MTVEEIGVLASPSRRVLHGHHSRRPVLHISRPPSYNSCLNQTQPGQASGEGKEGGSSANREGGGDRAGGGGGGEVKEARGREVDADSGDVLPSYEDVTKHSAGPEESLDGGGLPTYPPAYREAVMHRQ